jgi:hypothetical protein
MKISQKQEQQLVYVAMSRATSIDGLYIVNMQGDHGGAGWCARNVTVTLEICRDHVTFLQEGTELIDVNTSLHR